jgi:small-conductance mechanosensitive channel
VIFKPFLKLSKFVLILWVGLWGALATAQTSAQATPDYSRWAATADMAQDTLEAGTANEAFLIKLREQLALRRSEFSEMQNFNPARLAILEEQLAALGPAPESGTEAAEIAERRARLSQDLEAILAPRIRAKEAYKQADGLIREIDAALSAKQTENLLKLGPSPIDLRLWPKAILQVTEKFQSLAASVSTAWNTPVLRSKTRDQLPLILTLLLAAGLLLMRGRVWLARALRPLSRSERAGGVDLARYLQGLGQLVIVMLCVFLLSRVWSVSRLYDFDLNVLLQAATWIFAPLFISRWLASQLCPMDDMARSALSLSNRSRVQARFLIRWLGVVISAMILTDYLRDMGDFSSGTAAVIVFVLVSIAGVGAFRLGRLLLRQSPRAPDATEVEQVPHRFVVRLGQGLAITAAISITLSVIGYSDLAVALLRAVLLSAGLLGILVVTFDAVRNTSAMLSTDPSAGHDSLAAVVVNASLTVASLPVFALILGVRRSELTELWSTFKSGVTLGEVQLSPGVVLQLIIVFVIGLLMTRLIQRTLKNRILAKTKIDAGGQNAIVSGIGYLGIFLAAVVAITSAGLDLSSLAIVAGALSVGIGFGLQNIVSNFVSGIILLIERPISVGDWIEVGGNMGIVKKISVRSTSIQTFDRTDVIVPNADLVSGTVTNYTHGSSVGRIIVPVGVAYGNDTREIEQLLLPLVQKHPLVLKDPAPSVVFQGFGADSLNFEIRALLDDINFGLTVRSELNHQIYEVLTTHGIEIPFRQRDIWIRNPEALGGAHSDPSQPS